MLHSVVDGIDKAHFTALYSGATDGELRVKGAYELITRLLDSTSGSNGMDVVDSVGGTEIHPYDLVKGQRTRCGVILELFESWLKD